MKHQWLVRVTRREGKQHATRATKTIHMKDEIRDGDQHGCTLEKLKVV